MKDRAEEKNYGCFVNKKYIHESEKKGDGGEGRGVTPPTPSPFCSRLLYRYLMTTLPVIHLLEFSYADKKAVIEWACSLLLIEKLLGTRVLKNFKR